MLEFWETPWLAGLLEGEGWFGATSHKRKYPTLQVSMTDRDVVERVARLLDTKVRVQPTRPNCKQAWTVQIHGYRAVEWMRILRPHMGERRGARIAEILAEWDAMEHKNPKGAGSAPATCHPEKPVFGGGLCGTCYMRQYRSGARVRAGTFT